MKFVTWACAVATGVVLAADGVAAVEPPPFAGCYDRVYDAAHLAKHKDQLVTRISLSVGPADPAFAATQDGIIAAGKLRIWVRGHKQSFDSSGACESKDKVLLCGGSISAAEADTCKSKRDGVRDCRIDPSDNGSFKIEGRPDGVLVSIQERLELVPAPYDGGPFLSISPTNAENRTFLLKGAAGACK